MSVAVKPLKTLRSSPISLKYAGGRTPMRKYGFGGRESHATNPGELNERKQSTEFYGIT